MSSRMPHPSRATTLLAVLALAAAPVVAVGGAASATPSASATSAGMAARPAPAPKAGAATHDVTLITGDVVHVTDLAGGRTSTEVTRPHGAVGGVRAETIGSHLYVIPDEALPFLASHRVDRRLFDVTGLIAQGYDDAHSSGIPLIVGWSAAASSHRVPGTTPVRSLPSVRGEAVTASKRHTREAWTSLTPRRSAPRAGLRSLAPAAPALLGDGVATVWLDGKVHADLAESTAQIGAPEAWAAGFDGTGVKVAVLDTGVDLAHPDLAGRVTLSQSFVPGEGVQDGHGHGTHTASTVGGSGAASGGLEKGVAPGADLLIGKVLSNEGSGDDSWVIAGMEWAAAHGARVISMSLSGDVPSDGTEAMCAAVDAISASSGALFVVAAGNNGNEGSMSCPSAAGSALTVAAVDSTDSLASFSSRGPRHGDYALKPDIAAPGVDILAAKAGGNATDGWYQSMSGTSMATPHVAGAAALLAQEHPDWRAPMLKDALMSSSHELTGYTAYEVGAGRVDLVSSLGATVVATGSAYFGFVAWPHPSPAPATRTITFTNDAATPTTLHLAEEVHVAGGPTDVDPTVDAGTPSPAGMFSLSTDTVTVPAHGSAEVVARAVPALGAAGRRYLGQVVATDASGVVRTRTQVGLYIEDERHTLHVHVRDRAGAPASTYLELQQLGVPDPTIVPVDDTGDVDLRLLPGTYSVVTYLAVAGTHGQDSLGMALLGDPQVVLDRDRDVRLDASQAHEVSAVVPRKTEDRILYLDWYRSDGADSTISSQYLLPQVYDTMFALPTHRVTQGSFEFEPRWRKAAPALTVTDRGTSVRVQLQPGTSMYDGRAVLPGVAVGTGTADDFAGVDVRGRIAVALRSDGTDPGARAASAAAAGAAMLLVVNDTDAPLVEYVGTPEGANASLPVVSVTARTGAPLLDRARAGTLRLAVHGTPDSPYVYDLVDPHPDRIPRNLTYRPRARDLAVVDVAFHGTTPRRGGEFRWDYRPYRTFSVGLLLNVDMPGTRVDYVSAQQGVQWAEAAVTGPDFEWVSASDTHPLRAGSRTTQTWFGEVVRPRDGASFWSSTRYDGYVAFNVQPWADGGDGHAGYMQFDDTKHLKVYEGGTLVAESDWAQAALYPVPNATQHYRLDLTTDRDATVYRYSPHTRTVWDVTSPAVAGPDSQDVMSLLQVDYHVDTDLTGRARGGRQSVGVTVSHLPGAVGTGTVRNLTVQFSLDDGVHWRSARLVDRSAGHGLARFEVPRHGFVTLRVTATDTRGNAVSQEVVRAYGLR